MTGTPKKAVLFVPFWRQEGHVGNYRVDRFTRWLADEDYAVIIVRAGNSYRECQQPWGREITVARSARLTSQQPPAAEDYSLPATP